MDKILACLFIRSSAVTVLSYMQLHHYTRLQDVIPFCQMNKVENYRILELYSISDISSVLEFHDSLRIR